MSNDKFHADSIVIFVATRMNHVMLLTHDEHDTEDTDSDEYLFWDKDKDVIVLLPGTVGTSNSLSYSCSLDYETENGNAHDVFADFREEILDIAARRLEKAQPDEFGGVQFLTLWEYASWKDPDTWLGPGEWESDWRLVGEITGNHLAKLAEIIRC